MGISGASWVLFGTPQPPSPHDSLHNLISQISTCIEIKVCSTSSISVLFCMRTSSTIYIVYRYEGGLAIWQFLLAATGKAQSFLVHLDQRSRWTIAITWRPSSVNFSHFKQCSFFSETTGPIGTKLSRNVPWMVLYKVSVFRSSWIFDMAARANNMLWLAEISKIFFSETNVLTEPKL
jgi:hypothetical protein